MQLVSELHVYIIHVPCKGSECGQTSLLVCVYSNEYSYSMFRVRAWSSCSTAFVNVLSCLSNIACICCRGQLGPCLSHSSRSISNHGRADSTSNNKWCTLLKSEKHHARYGLCNLVNIDQSHLMDLQSTTEAVASRFTPDGRYTILANYYDSLVYT